MSEKVSYSGVKKEKGFLYYLDRNGNVTRSQMARAGKGGGNPEVIAATGVSREPGWLYFIDNDGDVSRSKLAKSRGHKTASPQKPLASAQIKGAGKSSSASKIPTVTELMEMLEAGKLKSVGFGRFADPDTGEVIAKMQDGKLVPVS